MPSHNKGAPALLLIPKTLHLLIYACRYFTLVAATAMLTVGLQAKPDTDPQKLARKEAIKQLKTEGKL